MANKKLSATITIGGAVASSLKSAFGSVKGGVAEVGSAIRNAERQQKLLSQSIQTFGKQGRNVDGLSQKYVAITSQIDRLREAHERPEAMEEASVMMVGQNVDRIMQGLAILETQKRGEERTLRQVADYSMPNVSEKVLRIIISYTDYIKRRVWGE